MAEDMAERSVTHDTFVIERKYPAGVERVFAAFSDPARKRRWFAPDSEHQEVESFEMDFRVGGSERAGYRFKANSPFPGAELTHEGCYQDIVADRRIVIASTMALSGRRFSATQVTFEFLPCESGTTLILTHQAAFFEGADGPERRAAGWRQLLDHLGNEATRQD
jgi:uncharacterized protein YndB with AHSA1/START domain